MGLLDPFWTAVDTTVAGAGAAVGGAIQSVGDGISQTGRNVGDGIAGAAGGWGSYVNDGANYVKDATGAVGPRVGSAGNPLGLSKSKEAARTSGFSSYTPYTARKPTTEQKAIAPAPAGTKAKEEQGKARSALGTQVAADARAKAIAAAKDNWEKKKKVAGVAGGGKAPSGAAPARSTVGNAAGRGGKVTGRAEALKGVTGGSAAAKKPPVSAAAGRGGKVTGRGGGAVGAAKKPAGTVTGRPK